MKIAHPIKTLIAAVVFGACAGLALLAAAQAVAQNADRPPPPREGRDGREGEGPRREPPPQAYEDCKGKKEGDRVVIQPPGREKVDAHCVKSPKGLFARPDQPPRAQGERATLQK